MMPLDVMKAVAAPLLSLVLFGSPICILAVALAPRISPILGLYPKLGSMASPELLFEPGLFFRARAISFEISTVSTCSTCCVNDTAGITKSRISMTRFNCMHNNKKKSKVRSLVSVSNFDMPLFIHMKSS